MTPWHDPSDSGAFDAALNRLADHTRVDRGELLGWKKDVSVSWGWAEFVRAEGAVYALIQLHPVTVIREGDQRSSSPPPVLMLLFDLQGHLLDRLEARETGTLSMDLWILTVNPPEADGTQVRIVGGVTAKSGNPSLVVGYRVDHAGRSAVIGPRESILRVGIQNGKFRLLEPRQAASP